LLAGSVLNSLEVVLKGDTGNFFRAIGGDDHRAAKHQARAVVPVRVIDIRRGGKHHVFLEGNGRNSSVGMLVPGTAFSTVHGAGELGRGQAVAMQATLYRVEARINNRLAERQHRVLKRPARLHGSNTGALRRHTDLVDLLVFLTRLTQ